MRLDKYIATHSDATRSLAKMAIKGGRVEINGKVTKDQGAKVKDDDLVTVNGREIAESGEVYILLHKPEGLVSATQDEEQDTVLDLVDGFTHKPLHIAGRLDKDTTGVLLLTSDGQWSHRVTSPKHVHGKTYIVETIVPIEKDVIEQFANGVMLHDESKPTAPATLEILEDKKARLTLTEGKYHQVKRMFGAVGNRVTKLHRESVGCITLGDLEEGEFRELTEEEIREF